MIIIPLDAVVEKQPHGPQNKDGCNSDAFINGCGISASQQSQQSQQKKTSFCILHSIRKILDITLTLLITYKKQTW